MKGRKKCVIKGKLKFENYKNCLKATQLGYKTDFPKNNKLILQTQQRFKSERYNVFTEEINKIAFKFNFN